MGYLVGTPQNIPRIGTKSLPSGGELPAGLLELLRIVSRGENYLVGYVWRGRSAMSPLQPHTHFSINAFH